VYNKLVILKKPPRVTISGTSQLLIFFFLPIKVIGQFCSTLDFHTAAELPVIFRLHLKYP